MVWNQLTHTNSTDQQQTYKERDHGYISIHDSLKENNISRTNLIKKVKERYNENFEHLKKETEQDWVLVTRRWKHIPVLMDWSN